MAKGFTSFACSSLGLHEDSTSAEVQQRSVKLIPKVVLLSFTLEAESYCENKVYVRE